METHEKFGVLVKECWAQDPGSRPDMFDVCLRLESGILRLEVLVLSSRFAWSYASQLPRSRIRRSLQRRRYGFPPSCQCRCSRLVEHTHAHQKIPPDTPFIFACKTSALSLCDEDADTDMYTLLRRQQLSDMFVHRAALGAPPSQISCIILCMHDSDVSLQIEPTTCVELFPAPFSRLDQILAEQDQSWSPC